MTRRYWSGTAVDTTLDGAITSGSTTIRTESVSGWPVTGPYVMAVSYGDNGEEKILCSSNDGTSVHTVQERGFDGTSPTDHANGATVAHVIDATSINEFSAHVNDPLGGQDDHPQYLNTSRHDVTARHTYGAALGTPGTAEEIGTTATAGTGDNPAREDHVHRLGNGSIDSSALFATGVVLTGAIGDDQVTTAKIAAENVTTTELANYAVTNPKIATDAINSVHIATGALDDHTYHSGMKPVVISASAPSAPVAGMPWWDSDEDRLFVYDASTWKWAGGKPYACLIRKTTDATIFNNVWTDMGNDWSPIFDYNDGTSLQVSAPNTSKLRAPKTGLYEIGGIAYWDQHEIGATTGAGTHSLRVGFWTGSSDHEDVDGVDIQLGSGVPMNSSDQAIGGHVLHQLTAGDQVRMVVKQNTGGSLALLEARFWIRLISEAW